MVRCQLSTGASLRRALNMVVPITLSLFLPSFHTTSLPRSTSPWHVPSLPPSITVFLISLLPSMPVRSVHTFLSAVAAASLLRARRIYRVGSPLQPSLVHCRSSSCAPGRSMASAATVNDPAFAWSGFQYLQGQPVTLEDVKRNNAILVLEQWATSVILSHTDGWMDT